MYIANLQYFECCKIARKLKEPVLRILMRRKDEKLIALLAKLQRDPVEWHWNLHI